MSQPIRAHVVVGGFPPGKHASHDMDYARVRILQALQSNMNVHTTVSSDFTDCDKWIADCQLLICYVAGPFADEYQCGVIQDWLGHGGRWLALHGSTGGMPERTSDRPDGRRRMAKLPYRDTLGGYFMTHPPIREMHVTVADHNHPLTYNLPDSFFVKDEPYMVQVIHPETKILLTTTDVEAPAIVDELYGSDLSLLPDGKSHALGYARAVGEGEIAYIAPGHCHTPVLMTEEHKERIRQIIWRDYRQPAVHESISPDGVMPSLFRGPWETEPYEQLIRNAIAWGTGVNG
jgi:hypothetical protein